jgi:phosphoglycerate dehydrogenase-like enzyme
LNPYGREMSEGKIKELPNGVGALVAGTEPLTRDVILNAKGLKVISRCGVGRRKSVVSEDLCFSWELCSFFSHRSKL